MMFCGLLLYQSWAFAPGLSLPYPSSKLTAPQMPRPAPRAMTRVWSTWIAELKNSIQKPGAVPRTRRRLPAQPRPPFNMLLKAAVLSWASSKSIAITNDHYIVSPPWSIIFACCYLLVQLIE